MKKEKLLEIAEKFEIEGKPINVSLIESGHINKTYLVEYENEEKYILQYVNTNVFPNIKELMTNIENVTKFIREKGNNETLKFIKTKKNPSYIYNNNWRMQKFIKHTKTYIATESLEVLFGAGKAIGSFQKDLDGFPAEKLFEIIPKFHYTPNRYKQLQDAINNEENKERRSERYKKAKEELRLAQDEERVKRIDIITSKLENGDLPLRVTHNDTKLSNILFDKDTNKSVCLIDLDTIMPGSIVYDFGEGIRTSVTTAEEDEQDLSKINVDMERFEAFTKGFLQEMKEAITREELELLTLGAWMMTYENMIRFLADYLNGDVYYAINESIPDHNLIRVRAQMEILKQIEKNENKMKGMIMKYGT